MVATWVETALLFVAAYWAGCACAGLMRRSAAPATAQAPAAASGDEPPAASGSGENPAATTSPGARGIAANEPILPGLRPTGLAAARGGKADDLKLIKGIGDQNEERLHGLGIWHFEQIAGWTPGNVEWVGSYLAFPGRIEREDWVGQAKLLAAGTETEFARRAKAGEVESSRDDGTAGQSNVADIAEDGRSKP
jgi:predicted flap endonuclease-1-like 5' DNA nuclease